MITEPPALTVDQPVKRPTQQQIASFKDVPSALVADAMGGRGTMSSDIRLVDFAQNGMRHVAGPALTAINGLADILATAASLKFVEPGDILIASVDGHRHCSAAGSLIVGMLRNCGGAALITDGPVRDYAGIVRSKLPVWCNGLNPASPYTNGPGFIGYPAQIGGQIVRSGDIVVADQDGVVVVPKKQIDPVIAALPKLREEDERLENEVLEGRWISDAGLNALERLSTAGP